MPVTFVDLLRRLPLPNLKVYTAGSVLVLAAALHHALSVTGSPEWRRNATGQAPPAMAGAPGPGPGLAPPLGNLTRNLTEQATDVVEFMLQEPLCLWAALNMAYCALVGAGFALQRAVFGPLRVAEAQRFRDKFWNYAFYKFIFVFGVLNVQYMDEVLLWCVWFTLVGFLHLLVQLAKDRFEYLWSLPSAEGWAQARVAALTGGAAAGAGGLLAAAARYGLPLGRDTFAFMAAECVLVGVCAAHVLARYAMQLRDADAAAAGPRAYYTRLVFDLVGLGVEAAHVAHMVAFSRLALSLPSLVLLLQLRHLVHALHARLARHRLYAALAQHMTTNYPMASKEEVEKHQDKCAICWEPMREARKLPCDHLFHNSCLCRWVQQDASCPTCRRALLAAPAPPAAPPAPPAPPLAPAGAGAAAPPPRHNRLFHFDGSRYVSWLPSFSVEVTRVPAPLPAHRVDALAAQVQQMFPQYARAALAADLARTRSADRTVDNILEGRLPPAPADDPPAPAPAPAVAESPATEEARAPPAAAPAPPAPPAPALFDNFSDTAAAPSGEAQAPAPAAFPKSACEREQTLARRKRALLAAARRRYLARHQHAAPPAPPADS